MTEEEWLSCPDPRVLVRFLGERFTERKRQYLSEALDRRTGHSYLLDLEVLSGNFENPGRFFNEEARARYLASLARWREMACARLRDQFNPFWSGVVDSRWLTANGGIARQLLEGIEQQGAFHRMPILGDALEEAGCTDEVLLTHCRRQGLHIRGCWVVDFLLGLS